MDIIKHRGAPTRNTAGGVGSLLVDVTTGKQYRCTFAYNSGGTMEYSWKETGIVEKVGISKPVKPVESKNEEPVVVKTEEETNEPVVKEPIKPAQQPKRTNYTQYSKKSK